MARKIKGITIEIGGNTTKLDKAINDSNVQLRTMQGNLKDVERLLKMDPKNTELLAQKQRILAERVEATKDKLTMLNGTMKDAQEALNRNNAYEKLSSDLEAAKQTATEAGDELVAMQNKLEKLQNSNAPGAAEQIRETEEAIVQLSDTVDSADAEVRKIQASLDGIKGPRMTQDEFDALQRELIETERAAEDAEKAFSNFNSGIDEFKRKATSTSETAGKVSKAFSPVTKGITAVGSAAVLAVEKTEDFRKSLSLLEENAKSVGLSLTDSTGGTRTITTRFGEENREMKEEVIELQSTMEQFKKLWTLSGEEDSAVETLSNLFQSGATDAGRLQDAVDGIANAVARFPDTLKIESLADSIQETVATGEATGQFAELIGRLGMNVEEFNSQMSLTSSESAKLEMAIAVLNDGSLAGAYESWTKNNEALVANREAANDFKLALSELADKLQPIVTKVTELGSSLLDAVSGFLDWFNSLSDNGQNVILIITGIVMAISPMAGAIEKVTGALPGMIDLFGKFNLKTGSLVGVLITFVMLAAQVASAWSDMSSLERAVSVLGLLLVAVSALAVALGALTGIGGAIIAAAGIAAGIAMVTGVVSSVNKRRSAANDTSLNAYPAYADGGVIPPNDPYLALVGDNKREREIIAPESTLRKIYREESSARGGSYAGSQTVVMQVDGVTFARVMAPYMDGEEGRRGVSIIGK